MTPSAKSELTGAESYLRAAQAFGKGRAAAPCRPDGQARLPHAGRPHLERWGLLAGASSDPAEQGPGQHAADRGPGGDDALVTPTLVSPDEALITSLLASQAYQAQIGLLARKPRPDQVEKALTALLDAGGTLPVTALAQRIGLPPIRGGGFAAVLRQLLNYDGVQVLETLPDGRTLRLSTGLLRDQFELR